MGNHTQGLAPTAGRMACTPVVPRHMAWLLLAVSAADVATTAFALSRGGVENSPGGAVLLAAWGLTGLIVLKLLAMAIVWLLNRCWPTVGQGVGWGLAMMTLTAVTWNLYAVGSAAVRA